MKRCILFVVSLILCLCTMSNVAMAALTNKQSIVFLGDNVTSGYNIETEVKENFVHTIMNDGYFVSKFAYPDLTSEGLSKVITNTISQDDNDYGSEIQIDSVIAKNAIGSANYVLITTGGVDIRWSAYEMFYSDICGLLKISSQDLASDLLKGTLNSDRVDALNNYLENAANNKTIQNTIESFRTNLNIIVQAINAENPNAKIIIQTIYNPCVGLPENDLSKMFTRLFNTLIIPINSYIKSVASTNNSVIVADVANAFEVNPSTPLTNIADMGIPTANQTDYSEYYYPFLGNLFVYWNQNAAGDALIAKTLRSVLQQLQQSTVVTNGGSSTTNSQGGASVNTLPKTGQNYTMLHMSIIVIFLFAGATILLIKKREKLIVNKNYIREDL